MDDDFDQDAPGVLHLMPFFEAEGTEYSDSERLIAGFKDKDGNRWGTVVPLHRHTVEREVLKASVLEVSIEVDGIVRAWPAHKSPEFYAELMEANSLVEIPLDQLILERVGSEHKRTERREGRGSPGIYHLAGAIEGSARYCGGRDSAAKGAWRGARP